MKEKRYYSARTKKISMDIHMLRRLFYGAFKSLSDQRYFHEAFGRLEFGDWVSGTLGDNIDFYFLKKLKKYDLWPIVEKYESYSEEDIFDVVELLYDLVSKAYDVSPNDNEYWWEFDKSAGQAKMREEFNEFLKDYKEGYQISEKGEIVTLEDTGLHYLNEANIPIFDPDNVDKRIENAVIKFRRYKSSIKDRKDAVRDLADILEFLRPQLKDVIMTQDERDLFNIANKFSIRHHNSEQKSDYDPVWLSWIYYVYLATIHLSIRLIERPGF